MEEKATVTFENEEGKKIIVTFIDEPGKNDLTVKFDFGDEGAKEHEGLYAQIANLFFRKACGLK